MRTVEALTQRRKDAEETAMVREGVVSRCQLSAPLGLCVSFLACCSCFAASARAADADKLFQDSVRPLFERKCFQCHSSKADELKGNLKLETVEAILKGGDQGPAVVAGDTQNSFLLRAVRYQVEDFQMPPSGRLPDADVALIEKWVKALGEAAK